MFLFRGSSSYNESFKPVKMTSKSQLLGVFPKPGYLDCSVNPAGTITVVPQTMAPFKRPIRGYIKELLFFLSGGRIKIFLVGNCIFFQTDFFYNVS